MKFYVEIFLWWVLSNIIGLTKDSCGSFVYCVDADDVELKDWFGDENV